MLSLKVALRYLFAPKSHSAVNVISIISVAGVAVATLAIVCVLSVFNGFSSVAAQRLSVLDPSLKVTAAGGKTIANGDELAAEVSRTLPAADLLGIAQTIEEHALATYGDRQLAVRLKGVDTVYSSLTPLEPIIIDGEFYPGADARGNALATIGVGVAIQLQAHPGYYDWMRVYAPRRRGRINPANPMAAFRGDSLVVSGVFQLNQTEYDNDLVIIPLSTARRLLDYGSEVTALEIALCPDVNVERAAAQLQRVLGPDYVVADRFRQQAATYRMIEVEKWVTLALLVFILIIASFNIISTLSMLIIEKRSDMTTYRALGATRGFIGRIFLDQGFLITMVGAAAGIVLGVVLCLLQQHFGFIKLGGDPSQLSITTYPVRVELGDLLVISAVALVLGGAIGLIARSIASARLKASILHRT